MSALWSYLPVIVIVGILILTVIYFVRQEGKLTENLHDLTIQRGWSFHKHPTVNRAFIIKGQERTIDWEMELIRSGRSQAAMTQWKTSSARIEHGPLVIGPDADRTSEDDANHVSQISKVDWELLARPSGWGTVAFPSPLGGNSLSIDLSELSQYPAGSSTFQRRFAVLAPLPSAAQQLITRSVENLLNDWPESQATCDLPLVIADQEGIRVQLHNEQAVKDVILLERIINLGVAVSSAATDYQQTRNTYD